MAAQKHWTEYTDDWRRLPMAYWVHVAQGPGPWNDAQHYDPEAPPRLPHKGYAVVCVQFEEVVLRFSSEAQLRECIRVLSIKPLPTTRRLSIMRGTSVGPNTHWLSRLPAKLKSPRKRARLVEVLQEVLREAAAPNPSIERTASSCA
jgi:hypothetical protein